MKVIKINPELMDQDKYDEHKVKEAAEILMEAEEIKKDSVLMEKVKEYWKEQKGKIKSLEELKDLANNFSQKRSEEDDQEEEDAEE